MTSPEPKTNEPTDPAAPELANALRSPVQRIVLLLGLVILAAVLMTAHITDLNTAMRNPQP